MQLIEQALMFRHVLQKLLVDPVYIPLIRAAAKQCDAAQTLESVFAN
jgi:hypothetical protein